MSNDHATALGFWLVGHYLFCVADNLLDLDEASEEDRQLQGKTNGDLAMRNITGDPCHEWYQTYLWVLDDLCPLVVVAPVGRRRHSPFCLR